MNKYELLLIVQASGTEEQKEAAIEKVKKYIADRSGTVENVDKWGIKKFMYPINFKNEGYYVLINFLIAPDKIAELDRLLTIDGNIVRQMIVNKN